MPFGLGDWSLEFPWDLGFGIWDFRRVRGGGLPLRNPQIAYYCAVSMGFSTRNWIVISAYVALVVFSACDRHHVGEFPELQKEHFYPEKSGEHVATASETPAAKPTPADFFPETKPER